jgi:hypothetical protein
MLSGVIGGLLGAPHGPRVEERRFCVEVVC